MCERVRGVCVYLPDLVVHFMYVCACFFILFNQVGQLRTSSQQDLSVFMDA